MTLFLIVAILLIAAFLLTPSQQDVQRATNDDFSFPDNNSYKPVPRVYGRIRAAGNILYFNLTTPVKIKHCEGSL